MAFRISSLLVAHFFIVGILLVIAGRATATRNIPNNGDQMKHPEFLSHHEGSVLIPGFGRAMLPPVFKHHKPHTGGKTIGGHIGSTTGTTRQIPGGDDTFVPNPGFEVPIPGAGGASAGNAGTNPRP